MVKAQNVQVPEKGTSKPKPTSLLKKEEILMKFGKVDKKIADFESISVKIKVADTDSLSVAENHSSGIQQMLNGIELARSTLKGPYFETSKAIDAYAKVLKEPLERSKTRINTQITAYKNLQAAQERLRIEREQKEEEAKEERKSNEIEKLARIKQQLYARIYGGVFYQKDGTRKSSSGCQSIADCDNMSQFIDERFPNPDQFTYLKVEVLDTKNIGISLLTEHKSNLISLSSNNEKEREKARIAIIKAKNDAEVEALDEVDDLKKGMKKEAATKVREDKKSLKHASKGVRETVKFVVEDAAAVPVDFKVIDDKLVNDYIKTNSDRIKQGLKEQKQPIPGINFYVDSKFVTSG